MHGILICRVPYHFTPAESNFSKYVEIASKIHFKHYLIKRQSCHYIETNQLICRANIK